MYSAKPSQIAPTWHSKYCHTIHLHVYASVHTLCLLKVVVCVWHFVLGDL